jgi:hypothetical protein
MSGKSKPIMTRRYQESNEADSCAEAIRLLLKPTEREKVGVSTSAPDAARKGN